MSSVPPPAEELRVLDHELGQLEARRAQLLARRAHLLHVLTAAGPPAPMPARPPAAGGPEAAPPSVQNVLLALGGVLLAVAALAFTLISWGNLGIGGRSAVLGATTLATLAAPAVLLRRGLRATAETVAGLGLLLTLLDAYALNRVALPDVDAVGYAAAAAAVLAGLWTAYGLLLKELRLPLPSAVAAAQLPLALWALAAGAGPRTLTAALLVTSAGSTTLALWAGRRSAGIAASAGAAILGTAGLATAAALSVTAPHPAAAARAGALLLLGAAVAVGAALRAPHRETATACAGIGALATVAATGGVLRASLPGAWSVPAYLLCGTALLALTAFFARTSLPRPLLRGALGAGAVVQGAALAWTLPALAAAVLTPVASLGGVWDGAPARAAAALPGPMGLAVPLTLLTVAATLLAAHRLTPPGPAWRTPAACGAAALLWAAVTVLPVAPGLGYAAALTAHTALAVLSLAAATVLTARPQHRAPAPLTATVLAAALASAGVAALLALADRTATLAVLAVLLAAFAGAALAHADGPRRAVTACVAVALAGGLAVAGPAAAGAPARLIALAVLAVPAATALLGARLRTRAPALPVELTGAAVALLAPLLAFGDAPALALVLALCGVLAAATALREERRPARYLAAALFLLATWIRLAAWDVGTPEAYTLPVTVPALLVGALRRRRDPSASSWTAYAPGLAATLLPGLAAAWTDPHWPRPLLLGAAALLVTLAGARYRLQAPLVLGAAVLALVALHELAPYVVQVVDALPRWLPPALAGLLLLALGSTYEQRLRDARRLRDTLGRMR